MVDHIPGATPLQSALAKLGSLPAQEHATLTKSAFEKLARQTSVPVNVLMALDEAEGGGGNLGRARDNAARLSATISAGGTIEDAIGAYAGEPGRARALLDRSYDIDDALYPEPAVSKQANPPRGAGLGTKAMDVGKAGVGGAIGGVGSMARGAGVAADDLLKVAIRNFGSRDAGEDSGAPVEGETFARGLGRAGAELIQSGADAVKDTMSQEGKDALAGFQPSGELLSPGSWSMGDDPSIFGGMLAGAEGLGSMVPMLAAGGPISAAAMGGLMAGGEGAENGRQFVIDAASTLDDSGQPEIAKLPEDMKLTAARAPNAPKSGGTMVFRAVFRIKLFIQSPHRAARVPLQP